jgi:hypothetical protein
MVLQTEKEEQGQRSLPHISAKVIAENLTLVEFGLFQKIHRTEMLCKNWAAESKATMAPNIVKFIQRFNDVSDIRCNSDC